MDSRRDTLKIIGAIGTTCAFPFAADELYGQHVHSTAMAPPAPAGPYAPKFFTSPEMAAVARISELIIPKTDTPGAIEAGVPQYIDMVVAANPEHQKRCREGVAWLENAAKQSFGAPFVQLTEKQQIGLLTPLSEAADADPEKVRGTGPIFFRVIKNLTADGYYTSQAGLVQELGYKGNTALAAFPECTHEH